MTSPGCRCANMWSEWSSNPFRPNAKRTAYPKIYGIIPIEIRQYMSYNIDILVARFMPLEGPKTSITLLPPHSIQVLIVNI